MRLTSRLISGQLVPQQQRQQDGATMVEFAITCIVLVMLFGGLFDFGLAVHNYTLLKHVTAEATREIAVQMQTTNSCSFATGYLNGPATEHLVKTLGLDGTPTWNICRSDSGVVGSTGSYPVMRVSSQLPVNCYFLCSMLPNGINIGASSEIVIERPGAITNCSGPPPTGWPLC